MAGLYNVRIKAFFSNRGCKYLQRSNKLKYALFIRSAKTISLQHLHGSGICTFSCVLIAFMFITRHTFDFLTLILPFVQLAYIYMHIYI